MPRPRPLKRRASSQCESLEPRRLLTALVINDTPNADTITLGVSGGGIEVIFNGVKTDYKPNQYDSLNVNTTLGADTINVQATIVPTIVHYIANSVTVNVGDASGVQNIKATLNMNGVTGGPVADGTAAVFINDTGDTGPRTIGLTTTGDKQIITGLAPAEISIGVVAHPLTAAPAALPGAPVGLDSLALTTGAGADSLAISSLRSNLGTGLYNAGSNDTINIGNGSLAQINSSIGIWGRSNQFDTGFSSLKLDDSTDAGSAQFTLSAIYPPGPGAIVYVDFQGSAIPTQRVSFRVAEISSASINGGSGGNKFIVNALPARSLADGTLGLKTGGGNDNVILNATAGGTVVNVDGQGGDDAFTAGPLGPFAPSGINGNLNFAGGAGANSLTIFGPQSNLLDIPTVPVNVTAGLLQHRDLTIHYADLSTLQLEHGNYQINEDLGLITLAVASEKSDISFESTTDVTFNATQHLQSLDISAGTVSLAGSIVLNTNSLTMTGGTLNLADGALQVHYGQNPTPFISIRKSIFSKQIFTASADSKHNLGYADSADHIVPNLADNTVLVTYAIYGDANLDKTVGFADLVIVAQHYGQSANANWDQGDFTYDSQVGFADLVLLAQNYGSSLIPTVPPIPAALPAAASGLLISAPPVNKPAISSKAVPCAPKRR